MTLELNVWRKSSYSVGSNSNCVEATCLARPWRKSTYSGGSNSACVEVATWRKSSHSAGSNSACVEVAPGDGLVGVRDSKDPEGGHLAVSGRAWRAFLTELPQPR